MAAVIFDLDGTLVDLFELHFQGFRKVIFDDYGLDFRPSDLKPHYGKAGEEIARIFFEANGVDGVDYIRFAEKRRRWVTEHMDACAPLPGAKRLLDELKAAHVPIALGTSNPRDIGMAILKACGLDGHFQYEAYREPNVPGKPAPDVFLKAARGLNVRPSECIVVEDSVHGVLAAKAAGMRVVAVATGTHTTDELKAYTPDKVVKDLASLSSGEMLGML